MFFGGLIFNFLCSLVPNSCNPQYQYPSIAPMGMGHSNFGLGNRFQQSASSDIKNKEVSEFESELKYVSPLVNTTSGPVEGYMMKTLKGNSIYAFEGIYYAETTAGINRFLPPIPKRPWVELKAAKSPGPKCLQLNGRTIALQVVGEEDCLALSIFSPVLAHGGISLDLPVVVFFHGGSYHMGSGYEFGPTYLLDEDVILVTVEFRVGVFGFMSTGDIYNPGNWGLKDQALALKWIHENIRRFGGDPKKITLMGHESGGAMAHLHMISNKTRNYFQSVVSLSGTAMNHWSVNTPEMSNRWTMKLANILRCPNGNSAALMECINQQSSFNLVVATMSLYEWFYFPTITFAPVVEPENLHAFLTETPEQAYESNHVARKPFIASRIANEGHSSILLLKRYNRLSELQFNWEKLAPHYLGYDYGTENSSAITETLTKVYFGAPPTQTSLDPLSEIFGDRQVTFGLHKSLQAHYKLAPTYSYVFTYKGVHNLATVNGIQNNEWGAGHLQDIFLYFNASSHIHGLSAQDTDYKVGKIMINMLVNFINTGEPYISEEGGGKVPLWEPVNDGNDIKMLQIDGDLKMISEPYKYQVRFWEAMGLRDTIPLKQPNYVKNFLTVPERVN